MFNKERFHNQLALNLGYERIIKDTRYTIEVEYNEQDMPIIHIQGPDEQCMVINAEEYFNNESAPSLSPDTKQIINAVYQAYVESTRELFKCYTK